MVPLVSGSSPRIVASIGADIADTLGRFVALGFNLAWAGVVFLLAFAFAAWFRRRARRLLLRRRVADNIVLLVDNLIKIAVGLVAGSIALGFLWRELGAIITGLGVTAALVSLALQDIVKNIVAGLYLLAEQPFRVGDRVAVGDAVGRVEHIDVRATSLRDDRGRQVLVPNIKVFSDVLTNDGPRRLVPIRVLVEGVAGPLGESAAAARAVVTDLGWPDDPPPAVEVLRERPGDRDLHLTLWSPPADPAIATIVTAARARFPKATVSVD